LKTSPSIKKGGEKLLATAMGKDQYFKTGLEVPEGNKIGGWPINAEKKPPWPSSKEPGAAAKSELKSCQKSFS